MKKAFFLTLALIMGGKYAIAQEGENDLKNFRFGLKVGGALTWFSPDDKKKFESGGVSAKGSYGLMMEFRLNKVASLATGFQLDYDGGKLNMINDSNFYFLSKDSEFLVRTDSVGGSSKWVVKSRTYNTTYVTLPLTLKLKTNEIGYLTYFGMFGINTSFRLKSRVNDEVNAVSGGPFNQNFGAASKQEDLDNTKDMQLFRFALNVGAGAEYNLSGSTSLVFGLNWYNGFSNVLQKDSEYLFRSQNNGYAATKQKARSSAIALTVGILF
jgi:Outer membrane protein beta-barrel domain